MPAMRALLVVNPKATTTSARSRDVLVRALRSEVSLELEYTQRRGHAAELARQAVKEGMDVVVTLGGDGTINEVVNGLLTDGPSEAVPALAVVPGGSTNVFAGALGLPRDWAEGTSVILEALRERRTRTIGLGRANQRWFTFCAGMGFDAEVIRRVERARSQGRISTPALYLREALAQFATTRDRRHPPMTLHRPGAEPITGLAAIIVQNTSPWTYLGNRPINPSPGASFDLGLDAVAQRTLGISSTARTAFHLLSRTPPRGRRVVRLHDVDEFTLSSLLPQAYQLDGDYLGETDRIVFKSEPRALRVVC